MATMRARHGDQSFIYFAGAQAIQIKKHINSCLLVLAVDTDVKDGAMRAGEGCNYFRRRMRVKRGWLLGRRFLRRHVEKKAATI
jgi:hypothetical protein